MTLYRIRSRPRSESGDRAPSPSQEELIEMLTAMVATHARTWRRGPLGAVFVRAPGVTMAMVQLGSASIAWVPRWAWGASCWDGIWTLYLGYVQLSIGGPTLSSPRGDE